MIYEPDRVLQNFAERTQINLQAIRHLKDNGGDVYEVTQFINSLLGLLIFPRERFFQYIPAINHNQMHQAGWPLPQVAHPFRQVNNPRQLIRRLRNGIVHCNIKFLSENSDSLNGTPEIIGVIIHDIKANGQKDWEATFSLRDLEIITQKLLEIMLQIPIAEGVPLGESAASDGSS